MYTSHYFDKSGYLPPWGWQLCRVLGGSFREMGGSFAVIYASRKTLSLLAIVSGIFRGYLRPTVAHCVNADEHS